MPWLRVFSVWVRRLVYQARETPPRHQRAVSGWGFPVLTADPPDVSGAFGAGAVDYGYESRSSDPAKPAGSEDRRPCRRGDNIGLAADGAERGWVRRSGPT
ncbi:hypothetical protein GCM10009765_29390 [Fodinicola feengrottensis]|uniref:Uncharacterized protein n=1 Tax=Fodinicola feengrottensis TaxID=435914 RepID=A0ABN2GX27_9ACTN